MEGDMSSERFGFKTRFVSTLSIALVLSASWGCAPPPSQEEITVKTSEIGSGAVTGLDPTGAGATETDWDLFFSAAGELWDGAKEISSYFSQIKGVIDAATFLGHLIGILDPPEDPSVKVIAAMNAIGYAITWHDNEEDV